MPKKRIQTIDAWSYSRLTTWEDCNKKAYYKFIEKRKEPTAPALERGSKIHKLAEDYVTAPGKKVLLPEELDRFEEEFKELRTRKKYLAVEQQLALTKEWVPCDWFSSKAWLRVVMDAIDIQGKIAKIIDYKTGKVRPEKAEQLDLYALALLCTHANLTDIYAEFWYLDWGEVIRRDYTRKDLPKLKRKWAKQAKPMLSDETFKECPSALCRWCWFGKAGKSKGGPGLCKF